MKEQLKEKIKYRGNNMNLLTINEKQFLEYINKIDAQKRDIVITETNAT
jgi:PHD/YefM family antitoxin component YafN of YafNO toxin-antitoxin module